jgi:hypothetical protein
MDTKSFHNVDVESFQRIFLVVDIQDLQQLLTIFDLY